ncbi:transcriptional regulator, LacI family [Bifidobacterium saguini DSM 23967]|uniref:Transcriptional regulator, LacI family n=2 Tax=Bifidobacterium saguini TaxID=762210 RepID=A0A087D880_9BIFI|nr:LacI family DNA-binding transcriptional regulator [Bifidobacterium saguini]KFI91730.1 transcriptional regulator, LacI family [Bifidobacterium saguini DSM 23967]QTB89946.1 LacI family DNA-binding transcriptional regulator [Bifidobacterium saguini]
MVTMKDVGREAGVSAMTVSNVLRGNTNVTPETAQRVREAADKLHYRLNTTSLSARSLRVSTSRGSRNFGTIGLAIFELDRPYPSQLASLISQAAEKRGYQTVVQETRINADNERSIIERVSNQFCDGLIFSSSRLSAAEIEQLSNHRPTVLLDDDRPQQDIDTILTPSEAGARAAIEYLWSTGKRHIGIVGGVYESADNNEMSDSNDTRHRRLRGCRNAFAQFGVDWADVPMIDAPWNDADACKAIAANADLVRSCDALFCMTDTTAFGVIRGLKDIGLSVPDDIAVMGFDGIEMGAIMTPSLTTVAVDIPMVAQKAVDMLIERIDDESDRKRQRIVANFHIAHRESA